MLGFSTSSNLLQIEISNHLGSKIKSQKVITQRTQRKIRVRKAHPKRHKIKNIHKNKIKNCKPKNNIWIVSQIRINMLLKNKQMNKVLNKKMETSPENLQ